MDELLAAAEKAPLPTQEQSDQCDAAYSIYFANHKGFPPIASEAFRAGWFWRAALTPSERQEAAAAGQGETEEAVAADAYRHIATTIGTLPGYSVQEHVETMHQVLHACADFLHDFVGSAAGGDDEAVSLAADVRNTLHGRIDLVQVGE